ncbi:MAG: Holliday junction branch migration DNA helicase RuvB [Planctomycetota bacterium]|nr:Holliday junction branch migration DNA helicase RuvB [Pirellulaceae bacterium]MEC9148297.1 Holliday junction branch migration DNA helicase RuvB [Planctomycetota bacterium]
MAREAVLGGSAEQPEPEDRALRPQKMSEMIGQKDVIERLRIVVDAAQKRGEVLGHILFDGPPGLGKTTFATCIPNELGVHVEFASGPSLKAPKDIVPYLTNAADRSVLFIDEIHRMPKSVEEYLYTAMEDFRIDMVLGEGINARTHSFRLNPFTLIGATTRAGMLSGPLRDRFTIREHLTFYSTDELAQILKRSAGKLRVDLQEDAANEIACRSRGTPRIANNRLLWIRDFAESRADGNISFPVACSAMQMAGIDSLGLDRQDRGYLETLIRVFAGGPTGIESIAHTMNASVDTLSDEVEPFLLRSELVVRTPRGRIATAKAFTHLNLEQPTSPGGPDDPMPF